MKSYVLGFAFAEAKYGRLYGVYLLRKKNGPSHYEEMAGMLNGIGGKIEQGETPKEAMIREFQEEAGVQITAWKSIGVMGGTNQGESWQCSLFATELSSENTDLMNKVVLKNDMEEPIEFRLVHDLGTGIGSNAYSGARLTKNLPLLIESAKYALDGQPEMSYFNWNS